MNRMEKFYEWWTQKIKGRYITNTEFENIKYKLNG